MPGLLDPDFWQYNGVTSGLLRPSPPQSSGLLTRPLDSDVYGPNASAAQTGLLQLAAAPRPPKTRIPPTNPPQLPPDPETLPPDHSVRIGPPSDLYPDGYFVIQKQMKNGGLQPIDPSTMKPGKNMGETHVPLPPIPVPLFRPPILPPLPFMVLTPEMRRMIFPDNEA